MMWTVLMPPPPAAPCRVGAVQASVRQAAHPPAAIAAAAAPHSGLLMGAAAARRWRPRVAHCWLKPADSLRPPWHKLG